MWLRILAFSLLLAPAGVTAAELTVEPRELDDLKAVFATVESANVVPARARIGGTVATLEVDEGDRVAAGQAIAGIGDEKLTLRIGSLDAQIAAAEAELAQARTDLERAQALFERGTTSQARLDLASTAVRVADNRLKSLTAERSVVEQQLAEGEVLAPAGGRVLEVPVTVGTVVLPGETIASVADESYVLRLRVPERHARFLAAGDPVILGGAEIGLEMAREGTISLVYPEIEDGRVVADAEVEGLGEFLVGERVRVWIRAGSRTGFVVPQTFLETRFGVDYVKVRRDDGSEIDVPVQRGLAAPTDDMPDGVEILSGLRAGDVVVGP